jgi:hypothetical protein
MKIRTNEAMARKSGSTGNLRWPRPRSGGLAGHARADGNLQTQETKQGLNLEIVDQDGLRCLPTVPRSKQTLLIFIARHSAAGSLLADRTNAVRRILEREGLTISQTCAVFAKKSGTTEPLFPDRSLGVGLKP